MHKTTDITPAKPTRARTATLTVAYIAVAVALQVVCAWLTVPSVIPFTLQTFGVFFALCFLGGARGTAAVAVYLALGMTGLPVFSGFRGGVAALMGPTGGYLVGFLASALLYWAGSLLWRRKGVNVWGQCVLCAVGLAACYLLGTVWFIYVYHAVATWSKALLLCVVPYLLPDAVKIALAVTVAKVLRRALPAVAERMARRGAEPAKGAQGTKADDSKAASTNE